jgi:hypothetical protein
MTEYLSSPTIRDWFTDYSKNYRDALAHRIPLYVPPFMVTKEQGERWQKLDAESMSAVRDHRFEEGERLQSERDALGMACAVFRHSFTDSDGERAVLLHPQMLADAATITELLEKVRADVKANGWGTPAP